MRVDDVASNICLALLHGAVCGEGCLASSRCRPRSRCRRRGGRESHCRKRRHYARRRYCCAHGKGWQMLLADSFNAL